MHRRRAAAIFVDPAAHIERRRRQVGDLAVRRAAHQHIAAALARPALDPVDVAAIDPNLAETDRLADDQFRGDRRAPGTIGEGFAHELAHWTRILRPSRRWLRRLLRMRLFLNAIINLYQV